MALGAPPFFISPFILMEKRDWISANENNSCSSSVNADLDREQNNDKNYLLKKPSGAHAFWEGAKDKGEAAPRPLALSRRTNKKQEHNRTNEGRTGGQ